MEGGSDLCLQRSALRKYLRHVYSRLPDRESRLQGHEASGRVAARRRDLQVLGGLGVLAGHCGEYTRPWISSSARRSTPCRARRRPSACRTPRGDSISRQASGVSRSDPRAIQACSVTQESPCHPTESRGVELCRNPATGGESSCHHLAARLVGTVCCRTSSAPNKKMKYLDSLVATLWMLLKCLSASAPSPSP